MIDLNVVGTDNSNAVWQFSTDILIKQSIRVSANYFYDELVLDKEQISKVKKMD